MRVAQLMSQPAVTCNVNGSANEAARLMWEHDCGAIPVVDDEGKVVGIVTDRDVCMAAYTQGESLHRIPVISAMAKSVSRCHPEDTVEKAEALMSELQVRRLPVVDPEDRPVGLLSINDLAQEAARPRALGNGMQRQFLAAMGAISRPRSSEIQAIAAAVKPQPAMATAAG
jgi:CBS domain-containing protein